MKSPFPKVVVLMVFSTALVYTGAFLSEYGVINMKPKKAFSITEPMLIEGENQNHYSLLPAGTILYHDKSWPEGHDTFHVYFHFKGKLDSEPANAEIIAPLWLRSVDSTEVSKLMHDYPISKDELVKILKAKKMTREELAQIVREWTE